MLWVSVGYARNDPQSKETFTVIAGREDGEDNQFGVESHRPDNHAIIEAIFQIDNHRIELEIGTKFRLDFRGASINKLIWDDFTTINLRGADLLHTDLPGIGFAFHEFMYDRKVDFSGVSLYPDSPDG